MSRDEASHPNTLGRYKVAHLRRATPVAISHERIIAIQVSHSPDKRILASLRIDEVSLLHLAMHHQAIEVAQLRIQLVLSAHILFEGVNVHRLGVAI